MTGMDDPATLAPPAATDLAAHLAAGLDHVRSSPIDGGVLELVVARPAEGERHVLAEGLLDPVVGLVGDNWRERPSRRSVDGRAHPDMQLNLVNARAMALICPDPARRPLAGDQLHVDLALGGDVLPAGTRVAVGEAGAVIEITAQPHTGCVKFSARFGPEALRLVNSAEGRALNLRGINARVVAGGAIRPGDELRRL